MDEVLKHKDRSKVEITDKRRRKKFKLEVDDRLVIKHRYALIPERDENA